MIAMPCEFYGGPLAGQVHSIEDPPTIYRVPSFTSISVLSHDKSDMDRPLRDLIEVEEYRLGPGRGECHYGYTWINPAKALREQLVRVREDLQHSKSQWELAVEEIARLKPDAEKWRQLKQLIAEVSE